MVQTRGQQTGDQSPSSRGALRGVTAEGDAASTGVTSGATLKPAVLVSSTEPSAAVLAGSSVGRDGPVSSQGAGSSHTISVSASMGASALATSVPPRAGDGVQMTDAPRSVQGCFVTAGAMGNSANADPHVLYQALLPRNPISQPIIYGDLGSGPVTTSFGSQGGVPNLFGLPAPVQAGTVPAGATSTVPMAAARTRSAPAVQVDKSGIDTSLQDRRLANYEAKLKQDEPVSPVPTAVVNASAPRGAEHYQMVYPGTGSASNPLRIGETASPWTRHQERAHRLSARPEQPSAGGYYPGEGIPLVSTRSVPCYDETSDDDNYSPGFTTQPYLATHEPNLTHPDVTRGHPERQSRRDWYEATNRPTPAPAPRAREYDVSQPHVVDRGPGRPYPYVHLAQMQDFQGDGSVTLDMFSDQVDELSRFNNWDEQDTCRQARAHLRGTALAYVRRALFPPRTWEELKTLLMKWFQPRDLTATYKAQFRSRRRCQMEDIYTYVETLQLLADLAWPFMDYHAKEEMVVDQFLLGMGNHELSVQGAAHGHRRMEDILRVARSLEAVQEDEKFRP